jgi:hypothetical protein
MTTEGIMAGLPWCSRLLVYGLFWILSGGLLGIMAGLEGIFFGFFQVAY